MYVNDVENKVNSGLINLGVFDYNKFNGDTMEHYAEVFFF